MQNKVAKDNELREGEVVTSSQRLSQLPSVKANDCAPGVFTRSNTKAAASASLMTPPPATQSARKRLDPILATRIAVKAYDPFENNLEAARTSRSTRTASRTAREHDREADVTAREASAAAPKDVRGCRELRALTRQTNPVAQVTDEEASRPRKRRRGEKAPLADEARPASQAPVAVAVPAPSQPRQRHVADHDASRKSTAKPAATAAAAPSSMRGVCAVPGQGVTSSAVAARGSTMPPPKADAPAAGTRRAAGSPMSLAAAAVTAGLALANESKCGRTPQRGTPGNRGQSNEEVKEPPKHLSRRTPSPPRFRTDLVPPTPPSLAEQHDNVEQVPQTPSPFATLSPRRRVRGEGHEHEATKPLSNAGMGTPATNHQQQQRPEPPAVTQFLETPLAQATQQATFAAASAEQQAPPPPDEPKQPAEWLQRDLPSQQPGLQRQQPELSPQQPGLSPQQPGLSPQQPGLSSQQPGISPPQPDMSSQQPDSPSQPPGLSSQQLGLQPRQLVQPPLGMDSQVAARPNEGAKQDRVLPVRRIVMRSKVTAEQGPHSHVADPYDLQLDSHELASPSLLGSTTNHGSGTGMGAEALPSPQPTPTQKWTHRRPGAARIMTGLRPRHMRQGRDGIQLGGVGSPLGGDGRGGTCHTEPHGSGALLGHEYGQQRPPGQELAAPEQQPAASGRLAGAGDREGLQHQQQAPAAPAASQQGDPQPSQREAQFQGLRQALARAREIRQRNETRQIEEAPTLEPVRTLHSDYFGTETRQLHSWQEDATDMEGQDAGFFDRAGVGGGFQQSQVQQYEEGEQEEKRVRLVPARLGGLQWAVQTNRRSDLSMGYHTAQQLGPPPAAATVSAIAAQRLPAPGV